MIVARPHSITISAWDGLRFRQRTFSTSDISHVSNQISNKHLDELPYELAEDVRTIVYFHALAKEKVAICADTLDTFYMKLAPSYEVEPDSEAAALWYLQA